jgi:predicted glycoside hydrolase/deacetylase ChbG (UPF0249 family)
MPSLNAHSPPGPPQRSVAICADDFGLHPAVDEAVLALAERRRLSAVSCMSFAPQWPHDAAALRWFDARTLDVGLHLDLTLWAQRAGVRKSLARWVLECGLGAADPGPLRSEIEAQLDSFEHRMGRPPAHVDGHQHVHQLPVVRELLLETLLRRYPGSLPWLRSTRRPGTGGAMGKPWVIERLGSAGLVRLARTHGFKQNRAFLGVYGFKGDAAHYSAHLARWLDLARTGDLLMCHPANGIAGDDPIAQARLNEYEVLASPGFAELLAEKGVAVRPLSRFAWP